MSNKLHFMDRNRYEAEVAKKVKFGNFKSNFKTEKEAVEYMKNMGVEVYEPIYLAGNELMGFQIVKFKEVEDDDT